MSGKGKGGGGCLWGLWSFHGRFEVFQGVFGSPCGALGCQWGFGVYKRSFGVSMGDLGEAWMRNFGISMGIWGVH